MISLGRLNAGNVVSSVCSVRDMSSRPLTEIDRLGVFKPPPRWADGLKAWVRRRGRARRTCVLLGSKDHSGSLDIVKCWCGPASLLVVRPRRRGLGAWLLPGLNCWLAGEAELSKGCSGLHSSRHEAEPRVLAGSWRPRRAGNAVRCPVFSREEAS